MKSISFFILLQISIGASIAIAQSDTIAQGKLRIKGVSLAYAGENIVRPGFFK